MWRLSSTRTSSSKCGSLLLRAGAELAATERSRCFWQVWDLGGQSSIRPYWRCYYPNTDAIVFVVDSTDEERLPQAKAALDGLLGEEDLRGSHLCVFANKQVRRPVRSRTVHVVRVDLLTHRSWLACAGSPSSAPCGRNQQATGLVGHQGSALGHSGHVCQGRHWLVGWL